MCLPQPGNLGNICYVELWSHLTPPYSCALIHKDMWWLALFFLSHFLPLFLFSFTSVLSPWWFPFSLPSPACLLKQTRAHLLWWSLCLELKIAPQKQAITWKKKKQTSMQTENFCLHDVTLFSRGYVHVYKFKIISTFSLYKYPEPHVTTLSFFSTFEKPVSALPDINAWSFMIKIAKLRLPCRLILQRVCAFAPGAAHRLEREGQKGWRGMITCRPVHQWHRFIRLPSVL